MSLRNRVDPQQLLAVSFALIMLVSMGGMAFVGGAGAQTGGTADGLIVDEEPTGTELGVSDDGDVLLTGNPTDLSNNDISVDSDGSITVNPQVAGPNEFSGVTVTPDRIGVADGNLATGLDDAVDDVVVEGNATPVVVIELAPQSNFSQTDGIAGTHDFIVIGQENQLPGTVINGGTTNITAYAVNNDNFGDSSELTANASFGDAIGAIVGTTESELQNENVDDFRIGAGTFGSPADVTVNALQISSDAVTGETIHSELIALDDGSTERYFNSVTNASAAAADGDTIDVATTNTVDTYAALEDDPIVLSNNELTVSGAGEATTNLDTNLNVTGNNVTVEGFDIDVGDSGADGIIDVNAGNTTLQQLTVDQEDSGDTGINVTSGANSAVTTIDDVTVNSVDLENVSQGDIGLALNTNAGEEVDVTNSTFEGHQTQIAGNANVDEGALLTANDFAGEDAQSAVARNTDGDVVGNAIFGSINEANAAAPAGGSIDVSQGTYDHAGAVNITTDNVTVTDTDDDATVENDLEIASDAGDVVVTDFDVNDVSTTAPANLDLLTFDGTTAESFDVGATAGTVTNATFTSTDTGAGAYDVTAGDTVDVDGAEGGDFDLEGTSAVDVLSADGDSFTLDSTGDVSVNQTDSAGAVEIGLNQQPANVTLTDGEASNYNIADVAGDVTVTGSATTAGGIDVARSAADVRVDDADLTLTADSQIGVNVTASGAADEVLSIENTEVNGSTTNATGVSMSNVDTGVTAEYTIDGNTLTDFDDGVGVNITEQPSTGLEANVSISDNTIAGGSNFVGIRANLSAAENVVMVENEIVGADVSGGADSVGIKFVEAPNFGGGFLEGGDGAQFNNNTITGHARLIEDSTTTPGQTDVPPIRSEGYTRIINELDNDFGTLVIGESGDFGATYGQEVDIDDGTGGVVYLPGSIDQAVNLVGDSPNVESADLQVYGPDISVPGVATPDKYDDDPVVFPNADDITVTGQSEDVEAETTFQITDGDQRNNHDIRSLTIDSGGDAITVNAEKAQSDFTNLDVTATGSGLVVNPDGTDVNVVEVRDSTFDVGADGISLAGTNDDRDGFVIDNVTVDGAGIGAGGTGLDLSSVEKPGKDGLPVNFTVVDSTVRDFQTQVAVDGSGNLPASGVNATTFLDGTDVSEESITVEDNTFTQAVVVFEVEDGDLRSPDLYGSVDEADANANQGDFIDVRNLADGVAIYDHGATVTIGTQDVTVAGPVDEPGSADIRENETVIADSVDVTDSGVTLEGLAVVGDDSLTGVLDDTAYGANAAALGGTDTAVIGANGGALTVRNVSVTSSVDPAADGIMPVGIGTNTGGELTVESTFVGDHAEGTTGSAIVVQDGTLNVDDSTLTDGEHGINFDVRGTSPTDDLVSSAYGVIAADGTSPTITNTEISEFAGDGINTGDVDLTIEADSTIDDNNAETVSNDVDPTVLDNAGDGGVVTNVAAGTFEIDASDVTSNNGVGVDVEVGSLDVDNGADVSNNDGDGVVVDSSGTVDVQSSTISENTGTGLDVEDAGGEVTVSESDVESNAATITADGQVADVTTSTFSADGTALTIDTENATVTDNTIEDSSTGLTLDTDVDDPVVTLNTIQNNGVGLDLNTGTDAVVTGNTFDNVDEDIDSAVDLDATLNHFGTPKGPASDAAAGVTDNVVYDPFLTKDRTDSTVSAITETRDFGHDVVIPAESTVSVGVPAQLEADQDEVSQVFDEDINGSVFEFNETTDQFEYVDPAEGGLNNEVNAFDGYVVDNTGEEPGTAVIDYQDERSPFDTPANAFEFEKGLNFVPPQQAGTVNEALFPGGETDYVAQPFTTGENLYGDTGATQVRDGFVSPTEDGFGANFRSGVGDAVVHPHAAYLVIVNEDTNANLTVTEQVTVPDGPTADNIAERTGSEPADYRLDSASATASAANNSSTVIVDVANIGDVDGEQQTVTATGLSSELDGETATQDVTLNAGEEQTVELTLVDAGTDELEAGDLVRIELTVGDESVKVTAVAE